MKKSTLLFISWILTACYLLYVMMSAFGMFQTSDSNEQLGAGLAILIMLPHLFLVFLGWIFNIMGWAMNKRGFALTGAILYSVGMFLFIPLFFFVIIQTILSYVGYALMKPRRESMNS